MGIALLTFVDLLAPLQSLACRWMPKKDAGPTDRSAGLRYVAVRPACTARNASGNANAGTHESDAPTAAAAAGRAAPRPLRVVRTVDAHQSGQSLRRTGRVILSGRLVDVCAELDRLAALEAAEISHGARVLH